MNKSIISFQQGNTQTYHNYRNEPCHNAKSNHTSHISLETSVFYATIITYWLFIFNLIIDIFRYFSVIVLFRPYLFSIIKGRKYEKIGIWILSLISQWIHAFLVFTVMGACFPQLGYTGMSTFHMGINDALIALCCLFWVEVAYKIYHKERIQKYKDAVNQSLDDPYLSSKIVAISSGISFLIICIAIFSTGYFANRSTYMLKQHRVHVTRTIEIDLLHLQVQFLIAMLALDFILILTMLMIY